jgi:hypothetical protein
MRQLICLAVAICISITATFSQRARALDTPNVLMTIDGMVMNHNGLFRNASPADGFNTFQFGPILFAAGELGRYKSFYFVKNNTGDGGISHNARMNSSTPEHWNGTEFQPAPAPVDLTTTYFPVIDRAGFGQLFDPSEYQIEVKFKPNIGVAGLPSNTAPLFTVGLDQNDGFVFDAEQNIYKRANDAFTYNIGSADVPINDWYASAPKDANGFATWTVPVTSPSYSSRGFYYNFGNNDFRTNSVVSGGGKVFNTETSVWDDVDDGLDTMSFGGGAVDPNSGHAQLKAPNGVPLIAFGAPAAETGLSVQVSYITLKKIDPGPIVSRIDANSGITYRFGSGFTRGNDAAPIPVAGDPFGLGYVPAATDQISRFDENGMTNLILNMRTPDATGETHRFLIRGGPTAQSFDGSDPNAMVNVRAKLLPGNTATTLRIVAKDLDGNDNAANPLGADEYTYDIALNQFNTSTFTTISVPISAFNLTPFVAGSPSTPFGFANAGDGLRTDFNIYEFGGLVPADTGLLKLELEYMEIRLAAPGVPGDFDEDGDVDGRDFLVWQRGGSPTPLSASDLATWKANYGTGTLSAVSAAVPEPSSALLLTLLGTAFFGCRRK